MRGQQAEHDTNQRSLPGPVGTYERDDLALMDLQVNVLQDLALAELHADVDGINEADFVHPLIP
jgi:hypothetical protein